MTFRVGFVLDSPFCYIMTEFGLKGFFKGRNFEKPKIDSPRNFQGMILFSWEYIGEAVNTTMKDICIAKYRLGQLLVKSR